MKNKIYTETVILPIYWAGALINGDYSGCHDSEIKEINSFLANNPHFGGCFSCTEESVLRQYNGLLTECFYYTFPVVFYRTNESGLHYIVYPAQTKQKLLHWQKLGLQYTATGYGKKIPTSNMVLLLGIWHRVYCTVYSNCGTCWINFQGKQIIVDPLF